MIVVSPKVILLDKDKKKIIIVINKRLLGSNIIFFFSKKICFKNKTRKIKPDTPKIRKTLIFSILYWFYRYEI